jgi:hypothetical protein
VSQDTPGGAPPSFSVVPVGEVPERKGLVSFLGSSKRRGRWTVPRHLRIAALAGDVDLDLREAVLADGTTHIEILAVLGSVKVTAPPGVRVESEGDSILGSFDYAAGGYPPPPAGAPVIRISGTSVFSSVEARVRAPGEGWWPLGRRKRKQDALPPGL